MEISRCNLNFIFTILISSFAIHCKSQGVDPKQYLLKFGYSKTLLGRNDGSALTKELKRFQNFAGIPMTGRLDTATIKKMNTPRCANKDNPNTQKYGRYLLHDSKWKKNLLTWKLEGKARTMSKYNVATVLKMAFSKWAEQTNLNFKRIFSGEPDIKVLFVTREHGDQFPFDGKGGTLAHAFSPSDGGDIHFDNDEDFSYKSNYGNNLLWVATHEIGHCLGVQHSKLKNAIMYPFYEGANMEVELSQDDIDAIKAKYGEKELVIPRDVPCPSGYITAIYFSPSTRFYVTFMDDGQVYLLRMWNGIKYGPMPINTLFKGSVTPDRVDAAHHIVKKNAEDETVLFSGEYYYIYHEFKLVSGPHSIHGGSRKRRSPNPKPKPPKGPGKSHDDPKLKKTDTGSGVVDTNPLNLKFPSWVKRIDAAMTWKRNEKTYFFADTYYWRYDDNTKVFGWGYPKLIQEKWSGVQKVVNAAYSGLGKTFFISGSEIYYIQDWGAVTAKGYPQHVACHFLNCGGRSLASSCKSAKNFVPLYHGSAVRDP